MVNTPTFGERVRAAREATGLTQSELARLSQVPRQTINNLELRQKMPFLDTAIKLAEGLEMPIGELITYPVEDATVEATS